MLPSPKKPLTTQEANNGENNNTGFRLAGNPAHRPQAQGAQCLLRNLSFQQNPCSGRECKGRHPFGQSLLGKGQQRASDCPRGHQGQVSSARNLLRRTVPRIQVRWQCRGLPGQGVRTRHTRRQESGLPSFEGSICALTGLDVARRHHLKAS